MNELLQKHGCSAVFTIPEGLKELMSDITREVLRDQPPKIFDYIANYLSVLLITREHGIMAVKILEDLCDCQASVSEHLLQLGMERAQAEILSQVIKEDIEGLESVLGKEKVKEEQILKKILTRITLDEAMSAKVCQVARNAYRDYWYRKKLMKKSLTVHPDEPWEIAAQHTLELYKRTKPSFTELTRATQKIQAAYRGYHVRRNLLRHLKPKHKKTGSKVELPGAPLDVAGSREINLGPVIDIKVREDDVTGIFDVDVGKKLGLGYDPMRTITHVDEDHIQINASRAQSPHFAPSAKTLTSPSQFKYEHSKIDLEAKLSMLPVQIEGPVEEAASRQRRLPSQMPPLQAPSEHASIQSRLPIQNPTSNASLDRISFAATKSKGIEADVEVPEELPTVAPETPAKVDAAQEGPEDILDDRTDGDGQSETTTSAPSSVPVTDVDDAGNLATDEEEE